MICISCDSENLKEQRIRCEAEVKGEILEVISEKLVCQNCGESILLPKHMSVFRRRLADAYRKKHGLLTSDQIKTYRDKLGMNQIEFAQYLGAGDASVKRWESNRVQDRIYDDVIRSKCDNDFIDSNLIEILEKFSGADESTGYSKFSLSRYIQVLSRVVSFAQSPLYFFKVLFLIDEDHFKKYGRTILGLKYVHMQFGPVPKDYYQLNAYLIKKGHAKKISQDDWAMDDIFNNDDFDDSEIEAISERIEILRQKGKQFCFRQSHLSSLWKNTPECEIISWPAKSPLRQ